MTEVTSIPNWIISSCQTERSRSQSEKCGRRQYILWIRAFVRTALGRNTDFSPSFHSVRNDRGAITLYIEGTDTIC